MRQLIWRASPYSALDSTTGKYALLSVTFLFPATLSLSCYDVINSLVFVSKRYAIKLKRLVCDDLMVRCLTFAEIGFQVGTDLFRIPNHMQLFCVVCLIREAFAKARELGQPFAVIDTDGYIVRFM